MALVQLAPQALGASLSPARALSVYQGDTVIRVLMLARLVRQEHSVEEDQLWKACGPALALSVHLEGGVDLGRKSARYVLLALGAMLVHCFALHALQGHGSILRKSGASSVQWVRGVPHAQLIVPRVMQEHISM